MDTATVAIVIGVMSLIGAVVTAAFTYKASSRATKVSEQNSIVEWTKEIRVDAAEARRETAEARVEVRKLNRELTEIQGRCDELIAYLRRVVHSIHDPEMTLTRLRELVPRELPEQRKNGYR